MLAPLYTRLETKSENAIHLFMHVVSRLHCDFSEHPNAGQIPVLATVF